MLYIKKKPSYWSERIGSKTGKVDEENADSVEETRFLNSSFEEVPIEATRSVRLRKLTKIFSTGFVNKLAVDKLSYDFCDNQITGFLGYYIS